MLKKILIIKLLALTATLAISGCSNPPYDSKTNVTGAATADSHIVFIDKDLRRTLVVDGGVNITKTASGFMQLQTALRNTTNDETLAIQVQTIFLDANGQALYTSVGSEAAWQNITLTPGQTSYYKQSALNAAADNYKIRVRYMSRKDAGN